MADVDNLNHCTFCSRKNSSFFCNAKSQNIDEINDKKINSIFKKGQIIFNEGGYAHGLFCINTGKIKLTQTGDEGREAIVRLAKDGDIIGYKALLSNDRYTASATALEDSSVCFIPKDTFFSVLKNDPDLSFSLMSLLSGELRNAETKIVQLAQKPVRERLAEALLFLKETYGLEEDGSTLGIQLSREEIANIVGTATESTIRLLSDFKKEGLVELTGKKIRFLNRDKLIRVANISY